MYEKSEIIRFVLDEQTTECSENLAYLVMKRLIDIIFSSIMLVLLIPVFALISIVIKMDSKGSVIFYQDRCGFKGKIFRIYKFRSMIHNAPELQKELEDKNEIKGCMFKIKEDPRVTRVGKILRKTSLDELPQLINVLLGDMSMVGPRPPLTNEVEKYNSYHYMRMTVKPGLTGLWQISKRNTADFEEMVDLDIKYIRERNILFDIKIIIKTIPLLFGDKRAC